MYDLFHTPSAVFWIHLNVRLLAAISYRVLNARHAETF